MTTTVRRNIPWDELEKEQASLIAAVTSDPTSAFLLVSEPQPTFTHGLSAKPEDLLWNDSAERGFAVHAAGRGGQWTYHGPGQVLIYPIAYLPMLGYPKRAARRFVETLVESVRAYLESLHIDSNVQCEPYGVYVGDAKIASFGISLRNGISSHGLAFYLTPQHAPFSGIIACGAQNVKTTSLAECGVSLEWDTVANALSGYIKRGFQASKN